MLYKVEDGQMDSLRVWIDDREIGRLSRHGRGTTFVYDPGVAPGDAVSLTMPVQAASYDMPHRMLPAFDTNMPEGALRDKIHRALAKDDRGRVDPLDVLALTGGNQIGRIRVLPEGEKPQRRVPVGTIDAVLAARSNSDMIKGIIERHALRSGVSGAMPKILAETAEDEHTRTTVQTRDWIMKFDDEDFPGLSLNEHHCLEASRKAGNETAEAWLSDDGHTLAVKRFDEKDGRRMAFEDFASLNAKVAEQKYEGSIESNIMKRVAEFSGPQARENLERVFRQIVTSIALRNGDAHLKNYALLYEDSQAGPFPLAPVYDIVTTRAWEHMQDDNMALTLGGTKRWPKPAQLKQLGARARLSPKDTARIIGEVAEGVKAQMKEMMLDITARGRPELAERMAAEWNAGVSLSLGADPVDLEAIAPAQDEVDAHLKALAEIADGRLKVSNPFGAGDGPADPTAETETDEPK